jgi:hypothetical protein
LASYGEKQLGNLFGMRIAAGGFAQAAGFYFSGQKPLSRAAICAVKKLDFSSPSTIIG